MDLTPGVRLGPYKIERTLGSGAMGAVYLAYDERLERRVALKALKDASGAEARQRLQREARAIARLNHNNIAAVYDVFEHDHEAFLVMEYVEGEPLTALVHAQPVPIDRALDVGLQLTEALSYAHREGIIHRDVKPANVMLTREGKVKVLDLGLARAAVDPGADTRSESQVELVPSRAGTPAYMAPERLGGHPADAPTDVYSIGVVLFELLTGKRPYVAPDLMTLAVNIATQPTPRVSTIRKDVPPVVDDLVARAMAKDRATRYASADELRDGLLRARESFYGTPSRVIPRPPRRSRRRLAFAFLALLALVASVLWVLLRPAQVPATLAIPPVHNDRPDQPELDELGTLIQSVVARNLAQMPGITIVPTGPSDSTADHAPPAVGYVTSVTLRNAASGIAADVDLRRGGRIVSSDHFEGDALAVLRYTADELANALEHNYALDRALTEAERASLRNVRMPTQDAETLKAYLSGRTLLDTSNEPTTDNKAADAFKAAIARDNNFAFAHAGLSQAYSALNKHTGKADFARQAMDAAQVALNHDQKADEAHVALALAHFGARHWSDAVEEARKALRLTPDNDNARRVLGAALVANGDNEGLAELRTAAALRPRHWITYYALGRSLLVAGKPAEAIEPLKTVRDHLPDYEPAYVNLGYAQLAVGQWDLSVGNSRNALDLDPEDHFALNNLATAYYWMGVTTGDRSKLNQALTSYLDAVKYDQENPKLRMNLSDTYEALGKKPDAAAACAKAIALVDAGAKMDPELEAIAAKCQAKQGDFEEAEGRALKAYTNTQDTKDVTTKVRVLHKLAVIYALWPKSDTASDKALDRLEEAVKLGFAPVQFKDDPDLRSLKDSPRFQKLIAQPRR